MAEKIYVDEIPVLGFIRVNAALGFSGYIIARGMEPKLPPI